MGFFKLLLNQEKINFKVVTVLFFSVFFTVAAAQLSPIQFSIPAYFFFSLTYWTLLSLCFVAQTPTLLRLLNFLFFMGMWLKGTTHLLFGHDFIEPAGANPFAFIDQAFVNSLIFGLFLILVSLAISLQKKFQVRNISTSNPPNPRYFYLTFAVGLVLVFLNWKLGFLRVGLASSTLVAFPFSILLSWSLGVGIAFLLFYFISPLTLPKLLMVLVLMIVTSVSMLSRNSCIAFLIPLVFHFFLHFFRTDRRLSRLFFNLSLVLVSFVIAILAVSQIRKDIFAKSTQSVPLTTPLAQISSSMTTSSVEAIEEPKSFYTKLVNMANDPQLRDQIRHLFVERWIGFEGLLVSVQNESDENFKIMMLENQKLNPNSLYQKLAQVHYPEPGTFLFYSFPGPAGAIFFASSWTLRVCSLFFFFLLIFGSSLFTDLIAPGMARTVVAWWSASTLCQFSLFPIHNIEVYLCYMALIFFVLIFEKKSKQLGILFSKSRSV